MSPIIQTQDDGSVHIHHYMSETPEVKLKIVQIS